MKQEKIGKFIKEKRLKKNLTQSEFANILGVTERTVSNWENGNNSIDIETLYKVCKVLNHMTQLGTMSNDLSKGIRSEINDKNSVLSIESLNAYVHNEFFYPKADNLIIGWDNIESFFIQLWESINKE